MAEILRITKPNQEPALETNKSDYATFGLKFFGPLIGALSAAQLMGPEAPVIAAILGNAISVVIPNQKIDRVVLGLKLLADKLSYLEDDLDEEKLKTEEFRDLLEDGVLQFARAITPERREHIANLLKNGLTYEELDHLGKKKLLALLNRLNDAEIKLLYYYALDDREMSFQMEDQNSYIKTIVNSASSYPDEDEEVIYGTYKSSLTMENLIMGGVVVRPTLLGRLLLKFIEPTYI